MAAGLGFKTFTTGEVLTAADTNGYLMQGINVFASTAARNAAITSPQEGQFAFTKDTNSLWYYDGAAWVASGATGDIEGVTAGVGITGGGTSGTVTITNDMATTITAAGDLVVGTGSGTYDNLPIGTTAQVLTADTTVSPYKVKWATPAAASVTFSGCSLKQNAGQSISNNTQTDLLYDAEDFDTDAYHSIVTNTNRITIPAGKSGYFLVSARTTWATNSSGTRVNWLLKNNVTYLSTVYGNPGSADNLTLVTSAIVSLVATDYITINAYQGSGGSLSTVTDQGKTNFSIQYLGA